MAGRAVANQPVPDIVAPSLKVLFCGINPGLASARAGHHFAHSGNRFWKALYFSGLTPELLRPEEDARLLVYGLGVTNLVGRATASAADLERGELRQGARALASKVGLLRPKAVAVLGLGAYRVGFDRPRGSVGEQPEGLCGSRLWALPNPSGAQAYYQLAQLVEQLRALAKAIANDN
jgi:TDG/mug DNA glycosylase family protein